MSPASRCSFVLPTAVSYKHLGQINFVDVSVDRSTDTVLVRASFPNPDFSLVDGQLVRVATRERQARKKRS